MFTALLTTATLVAGFVSTPTTGQYWLAQLQFERAWQQSTGAGVRVGVVDTGVNGDHPDLAGAVLPGKAFPELEDGLRDARGHGTNVAVLIAGRGARIRGAAPQAMVLPAKFTGGGRAANDAIIWAVDNGATVINLSLGGHARASEPEPYDAGLRYAQEHDVVLVAAAGNAATDRKVVSPANRPGVLAVSAVDSSGRFRPDISVAGPEVALAAPGIDMSLSPGGPDSGTSYSAAIVSGVAALVRAKFPGLDAASVVDRLTSTARKPTPGDRDPQYGFGVVDPVAALTAPLDETGDLTWLLLAGIPVAVGVGWFLLRRRRTSRRAAPRW